MKNSEEKDYQEEKEACRCDECKFKGLEEQKKYCEECLFNLLQE